MFDLIEKLRNKKWFTCRKFRTDSLYSIQNGYSIQPAYILNARPLQICKLFLIRYNH